ncbi:Ribonuclease H-like domain [Pseudocohnilembus persalinus]|uniref:DNA polymerase n=1 Tax=Pseudocohnilembus persalinus TaxID=266149 RepID=A0A0V0QKP9_PSEPJ|nr:Ribonuclease H-like domain [Pseudocohnilembus persalinus]|eukprot:KRX02811.1 Ribonuclease H-like domain [Pseudocohnilembus persalinus]
MHDSINIDKLTDMVGYHKKTFVRHPDPSQKMPYEFEKKKLSHVQQVQTEHALLQCFVDFVQQYDPDIILGHDIYGEIMDIIISRVEKTINTKGYKMARLCNLPSQSYKTAPTSTKVRQYTKGRLVVDTYLQGKELVKDTDYNLGQMSAKHLGIQRQQYDSTFKQMCIKFENLQQINTLIKYADQDAELTLRLMFKLQIIPLTKQLTNIGGNIWNRSLQNQRAERNEMLLMHQFFSKGYVLPDKYKYQRGGDDQEKEKKYKGGMVIEPKSGFYEDYVLLLDFNSLYPSIIQEYNLCFTTVIRPSLSLAHYHQGKNKYNNKNQNNNGKKNDNAIEEENDNKQTQNKNQKKNKNDQEDDFDYPELPKKVEEKKQGILPKIIRYLVQRRKEVKQDMARENDATLKSSLNIKQLAFKLVANSMYGCLGFESSRFYAKPIAALITKQGREILSSSVQIVDQMNYEVIYGDTDSLMIYPKTNSLQELFKVGWEIKKNVSKQYSYLIFDIDGIYKRMLLLKKKKYSCLKMENFENIMKNPSLKPIWKKEVKGLDIVRRDWSNISRKVGNDILDIILKEDAPQNVDLLDLIYEYIKKLKEELDNNKFGLKDFLITKQLTKDPSQYPDGKGLPHVVVAKRLIQQKKKSAQQLIGHIIYYAICEVPGQKSSSKSQAERAFDEMEILEKKLTIDMEYYKSSQILNVVERMVDVLPNMSRSHLADCLGLDPKKYQNKDLTGALGQDFEEEQDEEKNEFFQILMSVRSLYGPLIVKLILFKEKTMSCMQTGKIGKSNR